MNGSINKTSSGKWQYIVDIGTVDGNRKQKKKSGFATKRDAEDALRNLLSLIETNMYVDTKNLTLRQYLAQWLETYAKINVTYTTYASYRTALMYRLAGILDNRLSEINPFIIQCQYSELLQQGYSPTSVNYSHRILNQALKQAVKWSMLTVNPCSAVTPPRKAYVEKDILDIEEINNIRIYLQETHKTYYIIFMIAITTGMRRSEIAALEWSDINFETNRISVSKAMKYSDNHEIIISTTKNRSSTRTVDMTDSLTQALREWHQEQKLNKVMYGPYYIENHHSGKKRALVCTKENGEYVKLDYYLRKLKKTLIELGIDKHVRFHDLRHTHATLLLEQNVEAKVIQERLGHSNISTTMDLYSHVTRNVQKKAVEKLNKIM
jgi:integrase